MRWVELFRRKRVKMAIFGVLMMWGNIIFTFTGEKFSIEIRCISNVIHISIWSKQNSIYHEWIQISTWNEGEITAHILLVHSLSRIKVIQAGSFNEAPSYPWDRSPINASTSVVLRVDLIQWHSFVSSRGPCSETSRVARCGMSILVITEVQSSLN